MMDTYTIASTGGALKRIRTPHAHDVLMGRGGGINSHEGNRTFREWVRVRKNQYNLALSKSDKARVAKEVMNLVKGLSPPGRFLQRDSSTGAGCMGWWVEVDEAKAMAKTSQALREGAPQIRAAHKEEIRAKTSRTNVTKYSWESDHHKTTQHKLTATPLQSRSEQIQAGARRPAQVSPVQGSPVLSTFAQISPFKKIPTATTSQRQGDSTQQTSLVLPLVPVENFSGTYVRPAKRVREESQHQSISIEPKRAKVEEKQIHVPTSKEEVNVIDFEAETPPLAAVPAQVDSIPSISVGAPVPKRSLRRANSLALSDINDDWAFEEFVNPFEDESELEITSSGLRPSYRTDYVNQVDLVATKSCHLCLAPLHGDRVCNCSVAMDPLLCLNDSSFFR